jgi:hypothetical protein
MAFVTLSDVHAQNLLANPDFNAGLTGWSALDTQSGTTVVCSGSEPCGDFTFVAADECCSSLTNGAAHSQSVFFYLAPLFQCLTGLTAERYEYSAWVRVTSEPSGIGPPGTPGVSLHWFTSNDCSPGPNQAMDLGSNSTSWTHLVAYPFRPPTAQSALLMLYAGPTGLNGSSVQQEFDGAFFGPTTVPVTLQSFSVE